VGVGRPLSAKTAAIKSSILASDLPTPTPAPPHKGEGKECYAASAFAGFSGGVIAPDDWSSAISLSE
jgi:hypothetical protein